MCLQIRVDCRRVPNRIARCGFPFHSFSFSVPHSSGDLLSHHQLLGLPAKGVDVLERSFFEELDSLNEGRLLTSHVSPGLFPLSPHDLEQTIVEVVAVLLSPLEIQHIGNVLC